MRVETQAVLPPGILIALGIVELAFALGLATRWWRIACLCVVGLAAAGAVFLLVVRSSRIPVSRCGCLGPLPISWPAHLSLLLGMVLLALFPWIDTSARRRSQQALQVSSAEGGEPPAGFRA